MNHIKKGVSRVGLLFSCPLSLAMGCLAHIFMEQSWDIERT